MTWAEMKTIPFNISVYTYEEKFIHKFNDKYKWPVHRLLNIDMNCGSMGSVYKTYNAPTNFKFNAFKNHIQ